MIKRLIHIFLNFLLPQKCIGCGLKNEILCDQCLEKIDHENSLPIRGLNVFAVADYNDELIKRTIWLLKYRGIKHLAEPLAELIHKRAKARIKIANAIIIPIPLSKRRLWERGFNQSELIARRLSDKMSVRMENNVLYKKFHTQSQVSIKDREKRLINLKDSFAIKNSEIIKDKNIILIDDVCTTGATLSEAKRVLKNAGAKKIISVAVARG